MKRYTYTVLFLLFAGFLSCKKQDATAPLPDTTAGTTSSDKKFSEFVFKMTDNAEQLLKDIECHIYEDKIIGIIPYLNKNKSFIATFNAAGAAVTVNGVPQQSGVTVNDYSQPLTYIITAADGSTQSYQVELLTYTGLPILYLETEAPVVSKDDYVKGKIFIDANSKYEQPLTSMNMEMKGRGSSTWLMPKKPFRIKLENKAMMLGLPPAKKWVLLANFADKTLMRNYLALEIGKRFEAAFTPRARFVEVILNGEYLGNYLLTDQVEVGETRVNIPELKPSSPDSDISGGYLLEIDQRLDETFWFKSLLQVPFTIKSPEDITANQLEYIKNYIQQVENTLFSPDFTHPTQGYSKYINTETFINWFLVNELVKNNDAVFFSSVFMYKDRNAKLSMGPIWDFDLAFGNINYNGNNLPEGWWVKQGLWINRLFDDPVFVQQVKARWTELKNEQLSTLFTFINTTAEELQRSQQENFRKWNVLYTYTWPNAVALGSYDSEVQFLKEWISKRIRWMDTAINNL